MNEIAERIVAVLLPDATPSRRRMLERSLSSMTPAQLEDTLKAVATAIHDNKLSQVRDLVESRDLLAIGALSKWDQWINVREIEGALSQELCVRDQPYDVYSPAFEAHIEAYVRYHEHCSGACSPYDTEIDYSALEDNVMFPVPPVGHYRDYLQDSALMEIVEKHPERVSELVRIAAERRGISKTFLKEYLKSDTKALAAGLL